MTRDRDLERRIHARMANTGESCQTAHRQVLVSRTPALTSADQQRVDAYFDELRRHVEQWRRSGGRWEPFAGEVPVHAMQAAALHHPNSRVRRHALGVLDHVANDESVATFRVALSDPVPRVRMVALHGLSCERCRCTELDVAPVVAALLGVLVDDPSPKVRHAAIDVLGRFTCRDRRIVPALEHAATSDPDELVRFAALGAAANDRPKVWSRKAVRRRRRGTRR